MKKFTIFLLINLVMYSSLFSTEKVVFTYKIGNNMDIYIMNPNGSGITPLINWLNSNEYNPKLSPDGSKIAFRSDSGGTDQIWIANSNGQNAVKITSGLNIHSGPDWSHDSQYLYYAVSVSTFNTDIYKIKYDGTNLSVVRNSSSFEYWPNIDPLQGKYMIYKFDSGSWGPTATTKRLDLATNSEITLIDCNTPSTYGSHYLRYSPNSSKIAFSRDIGSGFPTYGGPCNIYVMNSDGSNWNQLTFLNSSEQYYMTPTWSNDGSKLIFAYRYPTNSYHDSLYTVNSDGSGSINVISIDRGGEASDPHWGNYNPSFSFNCLFDDFNDGNYTSNPVWTPTITGGTGCQEPGTREVINGEFHIYDMDSYGCGHSTMIEMNLNCPISSNTSIKFDINPIFSDVRNGAGDTHWEYPAMVGLDLKDSLNNIYNLWFCYNYRGGSSLFQSNIIRIAYPDVPSNVWQRDQTFNIKNYFPQAKTISKIKIGADGWNYESLFDNISIMSFDKTIHVKAIPQGLYIPISNRMRIRDSIIVEFRNQISPYNLIDESKSVIDSISFISENFSDIQDGTYYIVIKLRNCIETWSSQPLQIDTTFLSYDFTDLQSKSYGSNSILIDNSPLRYGFYSGDVNQDGTIDGSDLLIIENDAVNFLTGYVVSDLNGDSFVDGTDLSIANNNAANFVNLIRP